MSTDEIKKFIIDVETKFRVNNWKVDDIHLWPIIRVRLFLYLFNLHFSKDNVISSSLKNYDTLDYRNINFFARLANSLKGRIKLIKSLIRLNSFVYKLPKKENLFLAFDAHRIDFNKKKYNRFFDTFIEKESLLENYAYFELDNKNHNLKYHSSNIFYPTSVNKDFNFYYRYYKNGCFNNLEDSGYNDFINYLSTFSETKPFANRFTNIRSLALKVKFGVDFYEKLLRKINPSKIFVLCYYTEEFEYCIAAANKLGIETIEYQHGPQTNLHMCYSNWTNIPTEGYLTLPKNFWCWDDASAKLLKQSFTKTKTFQVEIKGNYWIDYWKNKSEKFHLDNYILFSLQPKPLRIEKLFPANVINTIANSSRKWLLRLHPRQMADKSEIETYLRSYGILNKVEIDQASLFPLPLLLANAFIHVTHFSGTAIEASLLKLHTLFINPQGLLSFPEIIENRLGTFIDPEEENFQEKFETLTSQLESGLRTTH